jgi:hypothetical protein
MGKLFFIGDAVRHHIYGVGEVLSTGYLCATVRFCNGIVTTCGTDNLHLLPY